MQSYADPYLQPNTSSRSRFARLLWNLTYALLFRPSPRPFHRWRATLLRAFGARIGENARIYPRARIWAPWNLICEDVVAIGEDAVIYNPAPIHLDSHCVISEHAFLCGASHDYSDPAFPMIWEPIRIGRYAWICARACVQMGVTVGEGSVLGLNAVATKNLEPWSVYAGAPARKVRNRPKTH